MKKIRFFLAAIMGISLVLASVSCVTTTVRTGRPIDESKLPMIVKGQTTVDDVIAWFGAPTTTTSMEDSTIYIYKYSVKKGKGLYAGYVGKTQSDEMSDELAITFDKQGKVRSYSFQKGIPK